MIKKEKNRLEIFQTLNELSKSENPRVRKNLVISLSNLFKSNIKNFFDKFFFILKKMADDEQYLVKSNILNTLIVIMKKYQNDKINLEIYFIIKKYLNLNYWKITILILNNISIFGEIWKKLEKQQELVNIYKKYFFIKDKFVKIKAINNIKNFCSIIPKNLVVEEIFPLMINGLKDEDIKIIILENIFCFSIYDDKIKKDLKIIFNENISSVDPEIILTIFYQSDYLKEIIENKKIISSYFSKLKSIYNLCNFKQKKKTVKLIGILIKKIKNLAKTDLFMDFIKNYVLIDENFSVRNLMIDILCKLKEFVNLDFINISLLDLFIEFKNHKNFLVKQNFPIFIIVI